MSQRNSFGHINPPQPALYSWSEVWTAILTKPSIQTFTEVLRDPAATPRRAYLWLYITGCAAAFVLFYILLSDPTLLQQMPAELSAIDLNSVLLTTMLCMVPLAGALSLGGSMLLTAAIHFLAERLEPEKGKPGRYSALFYILAAIVAPLTILNVALLIVTFLINSALIGGVLSLISVGLSFYQLVLMGMGVQAVYKLPGSRAAIAVAVPVLVTVLLLSLTGF